jgi:HEAT repeat protein
MDDLDKLTIAELGALLATRTAETLPTRQRVVQELAARRDPEAIPYLGQALTADPERGIRRISVGALEQVDGLAAVPYLQTAVGDSDPITAESALYTLAVALPQLVAGYENRADAVAQQKAENLLKTLTIPTLHMILTAETLADMTDETQTEVQRAAAIALGLTGDPSAVPLLGEALVEPMQEPAVLFAIMAALEKLPSQPAISFLTKLLHEDPNPKLKRQAARLLGKNPTPEALAALMRALVVQREQEVRQAAEEALHQFEDWPTKVALLVEVLQNSREERSTLDSVPLVRAVRPPATVLNDTPHRLIDTLIERAIPFNQDLRMTAMMAKLIIDSAEGIRNVAGERLNLYQQNTGTSESLLQNLRFEIGGATALAPVAKLLQDDLKLYFQDPIKALNDKTQTMWHDTIWLARVGFTLRAGMSVILFAVGIYLTISSYLYFVTGTLNTEGFFGAGASFVGGIVLMLATVYTGPLKDIRQSVVDVGTANAAFIGYVHRVQQISHTFSFLYLQGQITPEKAQALGNLIEDAMADTIRLLEEGGKGTAEHGRANDPRG